MRYYLLPTTPSHVLLTLQELLALCAVIVAEPDDEETACPFAKGTECDRLIVVLQGRLHIVCGSEGFESDRGPWTVLGAPALRQSSYRTCETGHVRDMHALQTSARRARHGDVQDAYQRARDDEIRFHHPWEALQCTRVEVHIHVDQECRLESVASQKLPGEARVEETRDQCRVLALHMLQHTLHHP